MSNKNETNLAPIAIFAYNRPQHLKQTIEALANNPEFLDSQIFVYCDGPKSVNDIPAITSVRMIVSSFGFPNLMLIERDKNMGLANSIITGVTELCRRYGRVIVLEDDLIVSPIFLQFMNKALIHYAEDQAVMQISGYMFPVELHSEKDAVFLPFTSSWGWATWERAWSHFNPDSVGYNSLVKDKLRRKRFDLNGSYPYFRMLKKQLRGEVDSWAIRWYLSVFDLNGLVLYPRNSLVNNIGFDGSGTHCGNEMDDDQANSIKYSLYRFPGIAIDHDSLGIVSHFLRKKNTLISYFLRKLKAFV